MDAITVIAALVLLPAACVVAWTWLTMDEVEAELNAFCRVDGWSSELETEALLPA